MNTTQGTQPRGVIAAPTPAAAVTVDWSKGDCITVTAPAGNVTLTHTNMQTGGRYRLVFVQDGGGARVLTNSPVLTSTTGSGVVAAGSATTVCDIYCTDGATQAGSILFGSAI